MSEELAVWSTLFLLGAYHGINPGMGWLFAVARGMQEHRARAVAMSLPPIALGHALSIGVVVLIAGMARVGVPLTYIRIGVAGAGGGAGGVQADPQPALPLGRYASRLSRTHHLVVSHGVRARRRTDGAAGGAGGASCASPRYVPRRGQRRLGHAHPHPRILHRDRRGGAAGLPKIRPGPASPVVVQSRPDMGHRICSDRVCSVTDLKSKSSRSRSLPRQRSEAPSREIAPTAGAGFIWLAFFRLLVSWSGIRKLVRLRADRAAKFPGSGIRVPLASIRSCGFPPRGS